MTFKEIDSAIIDLLNGEERLLGNWEASPSAMHIPYMGNRESFFLLVSLTNKPNITEREVLAEQCMFAAKLILNSRILERERAVEVAIWVRQGKTAQRLVRLSVNESAFEYLTSETVDANVQHPGIKLSWPLNKES